MKAQRNEVNAGDGPHNEASAAARGTRQFHCRLILDPQVCACGFFRLRDIVTFSGEQSIVRTNRKPSDAILCG